MNITMIAILCAVLGFLLGMAVGASMILTVWEKLAMNQLPEFELQRRKK